MLGFLKSFVAVALLTGFFLPAQAFANKLVFLEIYMAPSCKGNQKFIDDIGRILKKDQDVIVMNCNLQTSSEKTGINPFEKACIDRRFHYVDIFGLFNGNLTTKALVNGKLEASIDNVETAIKASRSLYEISRLNLEKEGKVLHISIPDLPDDQVKGELYLHVYAPDQDNTSLIVDPDVELTKEIQDKLKDNISVPFVTETRIKPAKLREVIAQQHIGPWKKGMLNITVPLERFAFYGHKLEDLGYVVSLHAGDDYGPVMAAGEVKPASETIMSVPNQKPIEQKSYPPSQATPPASEKQRESL
ncbi:MAG: hypothetical protein OEY94_02530 [Alphaproteobacteria bacterium]|nr:hypothetical protein [Alphaproteobacteria bacterium]